MSADQLPSARSPEELAAARERAIAAWERAQEAAELAVGSGQVTREMRLDANRRQQARRREQEALLARTAERLEAGRQEAVTSLRAVLAHRNEWLRQRVAARLNEAGVQVVGEFDDGAEAAGTVVAEQPDLVFVEDLLPTMGGLQVLRRVRAFAPDTVTGAQVADSGAVAVFVEAGAQAVFSRRIPPDDVADQLVACLTGVQAPVSLV